MEDRPTVVFAHGALVRDAGWWWSPMRAPLAAHGIATRAVALPSCGEAGAPGGGLADDVAATRRVVAEVEGPVVLVGHSYGGMVISEAGTDPLVTQLLYLTSVMPAVGESQAQISGDHPAPWVVPGDDGTVGADPGLIRDLFLQDCDAATVEGALARLARQPAAVFAEGAQAAAWEHKPSTFVVCTGDLAFPPGVQRRRVRGAARVVELDAGHHPFLSRPDDLAQLIAAEIAP